MIIVSSNILYCHIIQADAWTNGWMDDLKFNVLFNSISVISGRWVDDNERLCAMEPLLRLRRFCLEQDSSSGPLDR